MEVKLCVAKEARRKSNIEVLGIKYGGIGMTLKEILEAGGGILFIVLTLVQVAPIKVNPWTALGRSIGRVLNKEVMDKIEEGNAKNARYRIIRFNDEVKKWKHPSMRKAPHMVDSREIRPEKNF